MKIKIKKEWYIPTKAAYLNIKKTIWKEMLEIYTYESKHKSSVFCLLIFKGKGQKPWFHGSYSRDDLRLTTIENVKRNLRADIERKEAAREARKTFKNPYEAGDIFYSSWGYDQTNLDFYQVIKTTPKTLTLRPISSERTKGGGCSMSEYRSALKDQFHGEPFRASISVQIGENGKTNHYVVGKNIFGGHMAFLWDGKPKYCSWYA